MELITELGLKNAVLVISRYEDIKIQKKYAELKVKNLAEAACDVYFAQNF